GGHGGEIPEGQTAVGAPDGEMGSVRAPGQRDDRTVLPRQGEEQAAALGIPQAYRAIGCRIPGAVVTEGSNRAPGAGAAALLQFSTSVGGQPPASHNIPPFGLLLIIDQGQAAIRSKGEGQDPVGGPSREHAAQPRVDLPKTNNPLVTPPRCPGQGSPVRTETQAGRQFLAGLGEGGKSWNAPRALQFPEADSCLTACREIRAVRAEGERPELAARFGRHIGQRLPGGGVPETRRAAAAHRQRAAIGAERERLYWLRQSSDAMDFFASRYLPEGDGLILAAGGE